MVEIIDKLIQKKYLILLFVVLGFFTYKGVRSTWQDFKSYVVKTELTDRGFDVIKEDRVVISNAQEELKETKVETKQLKNEIKNIKGIKFDSTDITNIKTNKLLSKYRTDN